MSFVEDALRRTAQSLYRPAGRVVSLRDLLDLGWAALVTEEPQLAISTMAEEQGRSRGSSRLIELAMSRCLGLDPQSEVLAFALNGVAQMPPSVDVVVLADTDPFSSVVIPVTAGHIMLHRVPVSEFEATRVDGIDPDAGWTRLRGRVDLFEAASIDDETWTTAVAAGRLALTHELIGVGSSMLDLAVAHVINRKQFGVAIGTFQAVQHRLANVHVDLEAARSVARTAWVANDPQMSAAAAVSSRHAFDSATENCHQVMGAIGCTWEHPMHRYIRRGIALSLLLRVDEEARRSMFAAAMSRQRAELFA